MDTPTTRNRVLDLAKGIGMLFVICYHLVYRQRDGIADQMICGAVWLFLPLFFAVAGYTYRPGRRTLWENISHRFRTLLLPAIISSSVLLVLGGIYFKVTIGYGIRAWIRDAVHTFLRPELGVLVIDDAGGALFHNISPVWFVWTLWWTTMLFYLVADFALKTPVRFAAVSAVLLAVGTAFYTLLPPTPWSISLSPVYASMMLLGAYTAKCGVFENHRPKVPAALLSGALCIGLQAVLYRRFGSDQIYASQLGTTGVYDPILCYLQLIIGGYGVMQLCSLMSDLKVLRPVAFIGEHSLTFLLLHCMFGAVAAGLLSAPLKTGGSWYLSHLTQKAVFQSVLGALISVCCCSIAVYAVSFLKEKVIKLFEEEDD